MLGFAVRRSIAAVLVLFSISVLVFLIFFATPGVGRLTYEALQNLDLPVILGTVLYAAFFVVLASAVVDMVYALLDPRVRRA